MTVCGFQPRQLAARHYERRFISEAIHAALPRSTTMDCHASTKPFEARNDGVRVQPRQLAPRHCERGFISEAIHKHWQSKGF